MKIRIMLELEAESKQHALCAVQAALPAAVLTQYDGNAIVGNCGNCGKYLRGPDSVPHPRTPGVLYCRDCYDPCGDKS
jgi:hypothetical protein